MVEAAQLTMDTQRPMLIAEGLGRSPGGSEALQSLVELMGIPVIERDNTFNLPNRYSMNVTGANADV